MVPGNAFANAASTRGKWGSVAEVRKHLVDEEDLTLDTPHLHELGPRLPSEDRDKCLDIILPIM